MRSHNQILGDYLSARGSCTGNSEGTARLTSGLWAWALVTNMTPPYPNSGLSSHQHVLSPSKHLCVLSILKPLCIAYPYGHFSSPTYLTFHMTCSLLALTTALWVFITSISFTLYPTVYKAVSTLEKPKKRIQSHSNGLLFTCADSPAPSLHTDSHRVIKSSQPCITANMCLPMHRFKLWWPIATLLHAPHGFHSWDKDR